MARTADQIRLQGLGLVGPAFSGLNPYLAGIAGALALAETGAESVLSATRLADSPGAWLDLIGQAMREAYCELHRLGYAHSIEAWHGNELAGGLYGVALGRIFFGESMFSRFDNASKVAFAHLAEQLQRWNFALIDCQQDTSHMRSFGTRTIARSEFHDILEDNIDLPGHESPWQFDWSQSQPPWATR